VQGLVAFVKTLGATRIAAMAAVTLSLVGFFAFVILRVTTPQMAALYTDMAMDDSAAVVKDLDRQGVEYQIKNDGATIMVPKDQVARLRMKLAEAGIPKGGGVGYEIFDKTDALGATSFIQNINALRALEGELARTIRGLDRVEAARVHLVLPERPLFSRDKVEPSASIAVKVRGTLEPQQVRAIRHLVATAVNGLKPERISIIDDAGHLLADGAGNGGADGGVAIDERQRAYEQRLRHEVESIVSSVVGPGRARVQLTADFDFNRITQTSDKYDPDGRVVRSSQTREETSATANPADAGVSVSNELPGGQQRQQQGATARDQSKKTEEIVNYEISHISKTEVTEGGRVKRVSVAVLVDGNYVKNAKGELTYQPRSKEEIDRIAALVRTAIGFDQKRGDQVEVVNLRFAAPPPSPFAEPTGWLVSLRPTKDDIMQGVELLVMALLGIIVLLLVVRPLVRRIVTPEESRPATDKAPAAASLDPTVAAAVGENGELAALPPSQTSQMIDIAQVQGQVHAQSLEKVGELAQKNPQETVSIIRQWLHESAA
jgi:flagellar M-ring protein FliF